MPVSCWRETRAGNHLEAEPERMLTCCCDIMHQKSKPPRSCWWAHLQPPSASIWTHFSGEDEQMVVFLNYNPTAMKLGIFRHHFHPEEKWLLQKWNTSCMKPNQEIKERDKDRASPPLADAIAWKNYSLVSKLGWWAIQLAWGWKINWTPLT